MDTSVKTKFKDLSIHKQSENTISESEYMNENVFLSIFLLIIISNDIPLICQ